MCYWYPENTAQLFIQTHLRLTRDLGMGLNMLLRPPAKPFSAPKACLDNRVKPELLCDPPHPPQAGDGDPGDGDTGRTWLTVVLHSTLTPKTTPLCKRMEQKKLKSHCKSALK